MDKYLQQILLEMNTIIIPGLGALTVTNKTTHEVMLMPFLKHDDGNLAKIISEKESVEINDAKNLIAKYVREIIAKLDTGDSYDMFQFGSFIKKNGEIEFINWNKNNLTIVTDVEEDEAEELESETPIIDLKEKVETPKATDVKEPTENSIENKENISSQLNTEIAIEEKVESKNLDDLLNKNLNEETPKMESSISNPIETKEEEKKEKEIDLSAIKPNENVYIPKEEIVEIKQKQANQTSQSQTKQEKVEKNKVESPNKKDTTIKIKKQSNKKPIIIILLVVVILGGNFLVFKDKILNSFENESTNTSIEQEKLTEEEQEKIEQEVALEQENTETTQNEEEVTEESKQTESQKVEEKIEPIKEPTSTTISGKPFHLIVGGFGVESNAKRFAEKFQNEGKDAKVLGMFDDKYLVSYASFSSKEEANAALKEMEIGAWVFKYDK